ncbi:hypothetical protein GCM10009628_07350 [Paeniglutamicibacter kerguelensis]
MQVGETLKQGFRVASHAEGAIHHDGATASRNSGFDSGCQQPNASIKQDRNVSFRGGSLCGSVRIHCYPFRVGIVARVLAEIRAPSDPYLSRLASGK